MMPCTQGSDRDLQTQSDFCKALGLLSIHPLPMEEEPPVFAPTIGERVKRNLLLSKKVVSYKTYYGNKDVPLKLKSNQKLNKKKNSARKSSSGKAPALRNKPIEKQFLSPLTNLKSISRSNITNGFNQDNYKSLAQNLPSVNEFELSLEENHCQQVISFYSPVKPTADSNLHPNKNDYNYSSPFKIKTCCVLLTKCLPLCESRICELTSNGLQSNSLLEPMNYATVQSAASESELVICVPSTDDLHKDSSLDAMTGAYVGSMMSRSESVFHVPSTSDLNKGLLEPTSDRTVKTAALGSESVIGVPSTNDFQKDNLLDDLTRADVQSVTLGSKSVIFVPSTDDLPNNSLLKPTSDITVKSVASCCESVISVPSSDDLHKDSSLDVMTGASVQSVAYDCSKHLETIPVDYNLTTKLFREHFPSLCESSSPFNTLSPTSENCPATTSGHYEVETSLSYSYGENESLKCTSPMNVSVESNTFDHLPDFREEGCTDVKCNVSGLQTLESGSSSPTRFTIQIETQEELEVQKSLLSSAQESALHISDVFSLASSTNSTCSSSSSTLSLNGVSSEESDNSSLAMEETFHLPRIAPYYGVTSSQSNPLVTPSIETDKLLPLATTQYVNEKSSIHNKLYRVVATENRCGSGINKISNIIGNSVITAVETHGVTNESSGISDNIEDTPIVTSDTGNKLSGIGDNLVATPVEISDDGNEFSGIGDNLVATPVEMTDDGNEFSGIGDNLVATPVEMTDDENVLSGIGDNLEATPVASSDVVSKFSAIFDILGDRPVIMSDANEFSLKATPVLMSDVVNESSCIGNNLEATPVVRGDIGNDFSDISDNIRVIPVETGETENEVFNIDDNHEATPDVAGDVANEFPGIIDNCEPTPVVIGDFANEFSGIIDNFKATPVAVGDSKNEFPCIVENLPTTPAVTCVYPSRQSSTVENNVNPKPSPRSNVETFPSLMHSQSTASAEITDSDAICEESSQSSIMCITSSSDLLTECMPNDLQEPSAVGFLHNVGCEDKSHSGPNHAHLTPGQAAQTQTEELLSAYQIRSGLVASTCSNGAGKHTSEGQNHYECDNCQCRYLDVMLLVKHLLMHHSNPNQSVKSVYKSQTGMCNNSKVHQKQVMGDTIPTLHSTYVPDSFDLTKKTSSKTIFSPRRSGRLVHSPLTSNNRTGFSNNQEMSGNFRSKKKNLKKRGISYIIDGNGYDDTLHDRSAIKTILENSIRVLPNNTGQSECLDYTANKRQKIEDTKITIRKTRVTKSKKSKDTNTVGNMNYKVNCNSQQAIEKNCCRTSSILIYQSSSDQLKDSSTMKGTASTSGNNRTTNYPVVTTSYQTEDDNLHLQNWPSNSSMTVCADESHEFTSPDDGFAALNASSSNNTCTVSNLIRTKKSLTRVSGFVSKDTGMSNMEQDGSLAGELDLFSEGDCSDFDFEGFSSTDITMSCELEGNEIRKIHIIKGTDAPPNKEHVPGDIAPTPGLQVCPERYISKPSDSTVTDSYTSHIFASWSCTSTTNMCTPINDTQSNATAKETQHTVADLIPSCTSDSHNKTLSIEMFTPSNGMLSEAPSTEMQCTSLLRKKSGIIECSDANGLQVLGVRNSAFQNTNNIVNSESTITDNLVCVNDNGIAPVIILDDGSKVDKISQQCPISKVPPFLSDNGLRANTQQSPGRQISPVVLSDNGLRANATTLQSPGSQVSPIVLSDNGLRANETTKQSPGSQVSPIVLSDNGLRADETTLQLPGSLVSPVILLDNGLRANETTLQSQGSQVSPVILLDDGSMTDETTQQWSSSNQTSLCSPLSAIQHNENLNSGLSRRFSQDKPRLEVNDEAEVLFENAILPKCEDKFLSSYYSYGSVRTMTSDLGTNLSVEEIDQLMKRCRPLTVVAKRHLVIIDGKKKFKCHECLHLVFDSLLLLRQHYSNIHGLGLKCIFCSQSFEHVGHLRLHLLNHGQVIKFKCTSCSVVFGRALDLQSHSCLWNSMSTIFKCHHCQSPFMTNRALQLHISTTHFQDKPFKCEYCSSTCQLRGECVDHMRQVHGYKGD